MAKTLLVGPWLGEFGWELCQWQGYARKVAKEGGYDNVVVSSYPGHEGMYADFMTKYIPIPEWFLKKKYSSDTLGVRACATFIKNTLVNDVVKLCGGCDRQILAHNLNIALSDQLWANWHLDLPVNPKLVALVKRDRNFASHRNWRSSNWGALKIRLESLGYEVAFVPCDWQVSLDIFSRCTLAVGGSTGGMHLASLCGCPHLVWGEDAYLRLDTRYKTAWNPLGTPCAVINSPRWNPSVPSVLNEFKKAVVNFGRKAT